MIPLTTRPNIIKTFSASHDVTHCKKDAAHMSNGRTVVGTSVYLPLIITYDCWQGKAFPIVFRRYVGNIPDVIFSKASVYQMQGLIIIHVQVQLATLTARSSYVLVFAKA